MTSKNGNISENDAATVLKTAIFDLPAATLRWSLGIGTEKEIAETAWKGYDAWVRLANQSVEAVYRHPETARAAAQGLDAFLRLQRFNNAFAGAFFAGVWPVIGLPTSGEIKALRSELRAVRGELSQIRELVESQSEQAQVAGESPRETSETKHGVRSIERPRNVELAAA